MPATHSSTLSAESPARNEILEPFDVLDETHIQIESALKQLQQLVEHLRDKGVDQHAKDVARSLFLFFMHTAKQHHLDEEKHIFPQLINSGDDQLVQTTLRLQQDHGWIEEDWLELAPQLESISAGYNWYNIEQLEHAVPVFVALYKDHIRLEEALIYPEARARISSWNLGNMGREMASRRRPGRKAA